MRVVCIDHTAAKGHGVGCSTPFFTIAFGPSLHDKDYARGMSVLCDHYGLESY